MGTVHEEFDEARWVRQFPLEKLRDEARAFVVRRRQELPNEYRSEAAFESHVKLMMPKWRAVFCPKDLATCLQLRWERWPDDAAPNDSLPADVFVWAQGEPKNRALTKIGGLPYWPKDREWPNDGDPMIFVAQFNFADSTDIVSSLPGKLLSVFVKDEEFYGPEYFHFEWVNEASQLIEETPASGWWSSRPVFGQRYRTWDSPEFGIYQATKVGGLPYVIQDEISLPGTHLATLHSLSFSSDESHPFVNREAPLSRDENRWYFGIGDVGSLYIYIDDEGNVRAEDACY